MHVGGTGIGLLVAGLNLHNGLGNPDVGAVQPVSDALAKLESCYRDDTMASCVSKVLEKAGRVTRSITRLDVMDKGFRGDYLDVRADYRRIVGDLLVLETRQDLNADDRSDLADAKTIVVEAWDSMVKNARANGRLPEQKLAEANGG